MSTILKIVHKVLLAYTFVYAGGLFAKTQAKTSVDVSAAIEILNRYTKDAGSQIQVQMSTEKKSIGTKNISQGRVTVVPGKINITIEGDKKSEMIFDGTKAFFISYPDMDLDPTGKRKVVQIKSKGKNHINLLSNLFGNPKKFFSAFDISKKNLNPDEYELVLKDKKNEIKPMTLVFSKTILTLNKISYLDDVDTEINIQLDKPKFPKSISKNLFKYTKKKNDEEVVE